MLADPVDVALVATDVDVTFADEACGNGLARTEFVALFCLILEFCDLIGDADTFFAEDDKFPVVR